MTSDRRARRPLLIALLCGLLFGASACTNIPTSSSPTVVRPIDVGPSPARGGGPTPGDSPREIVQKFLRANQNNDPKHGIARRFLTQQEKVGWHDTSLTVLDSIQVSNPRDGRITVQGNEIGSIDNTTTGAYTPALRGDGTGGALVRDTFRLRRVHGEWRIGSLQNGLLVSQAAFETSYRQLAVYFIDSTKSHLVPDPRYVEIGDEQMMATWLIDNLASGPLTAVQSGPSNLLPSQTTEQPLVQYRASGLIKIEISGATSLTGPDRSRVAAEFGATLAQVTTGSLIEITDGGTPVTIPAVAGAQFSADQVVDTYSVSPTTTPPSLFFLRGHSVYGAGGLIVHGKLNDYGLTSVALSPRPDGSIQVAGVRHEGNTDVLDVGTTSQLVRTTIKGDLSRPAWAPDADEAWVGDGTTLYRVSMPSHTVRRVALDVPRGSAIGKIAAVRLSPEGSRIAVVLESNGTSQIYIGQVVRNGAAARVVNLAPVSPQAVVIRDVAWNDQFKLFAIGSDKLAGGWGLWELQSDGSLWTERSNSGLPQAPDSLTVAAGSLAVVSAGDTVWQQQAGSWESLNGNSTPGTRPIYAE